MDKIKKEIRYLLTENDDTLRFMIAIILCIVGGSLCLSWLNKPTTNPGNLNHFMGAIQLNWEWLMSVPVGFMFLVFGLIILFSHKPYHTAKFDTDLYIADPPIYSPHIPLTTDSAE